MDKLFKIGPAAKALGVSPSTLRRWEKEGKIKPERTEGCHRLYRLSQFKVAQISARLYGSRSRKNQKLLARMEQAVNDVGT